MLIFAMCTWKPKKLNVSSDQSIYSHFAVLMHVQVIVDLLMASFMLAVDLHSSFILTRDLLVASFHLLKTIFNCTLVCL